MRRIALIIAAGVSLVYLSWGGAVSPENTPLSPISKSREEVLRIKTALLLPQDKNIRLLYVWLSTALFCFLLESVSGRLYAFSGGVAAILLIIVASLTRAVEITPLQVVGWGVIATITRLILPSWIRTHNDELRDRRRVAREGWAPTYPPKVEKSKRT